MATVRLRDGEVTLYTRGDSKNWYAGFRLARGGRLQESLKTRNKAVAKERALERHDDLKARAKYGLTQNTVTFANAADACLNRTSPAKRSASEQSARGSNALLSFRLGKSAWNIFLRHLVNMKWLSAK